MDEKLIYKIECWIAKVGYNEAFKCLILQDVSGSTAGKVLAKKYPSQLKPETLLKIKAAMRMSA